jgi:hypothetical protein
MENPLTIAPQRLLWSAMPTIKPTTPKTQQPYPNYIPPNNDKHDTAFQWPDWAIYLLSPWGPTSIAVHALYHVINLAFNNLPSYTIPTKLGNSSNRFQHNINIEEVFNSVIHPITKEIITKYTKLMGDPALKGLWLPAMSKELHHLAQGKEGVTVGASTIFYLTHDEIRRRIPKDCTVTYARIVINHCPQKDDPNQVHITVGSNLINYPYKLTTRTANMVSAKIMWNSVISTPGAKFGGKDIKNMYLKTPLNWYKYMQMPLKFSSHMTPPTTTIYMKKPSMAMPTWKFDVACMVYHKPESWQTSYYTNTWDNMATSKYNTHPIFGNASPGPSDLICASTTLVSNTLATKISSTSLLHYTLKYMKLLRIGLAISTVASMSSRAMANVW